MNSRRTFLAGLGAAALAPHALSAALPSDVPCLPPTDGAYIVGAMSNPLLPGPAGGFVLKTWLSVESDGTGFGILTDRYDPDFSSHLFVQSTARHGNRHTWQGFVTRSNQPRLIGQPFTLSAGFDCGVVSLELALLGDTFSGQGIITN